MIRLSGNYFDGKSSKPSPVTAIFSKKSLRLEGKGISIQNISTKMCKVPPPLGITTRSILLPGGGRFDTGELEAMKAVDKLLGTNKGMGIVHTLESRWRLVTGCFAGLLVCTWLFIVYGIPYMAYKTAQAIPVTVNKKISEQTLKILDENYLKKSTLGEERIRELTGLFNKLVSTGKSRFEYNLHLRSGKGLIGANAFALPSGIILMTDELVNLAKSDEELIGILYHEITHVEKCHGMRSVLQNAGVFLLVSALVGDVASITSVASTLPAMLAQTGYSRNFEREADKYAGLYMIEKGYGTKPLEDILERLTKLKPHIPGESLLSTHPETLERIKILKSLNN